ncbi:hypothetical protein Tco_1132074 [Tanacetum coccineum]|uniref:Reverse transcriptase domain-containing protein n=1 Tax=Tanacetum coccineum TaxID=301880 RepID=A0ABQ5JDZ3_9ASTR
MDLLLIQRSQSLQEKVNNKLSQGLLRHFFNTLNQTEMAKEIWENVELLMQGSGLTEQQKKETLFDQYESSSEEYHVFNNLPSYWGKYVTIVKNSKDISTATHSTSSPSQYVPPPPHYAPAPQQAPQSTNDAMLAMMNQIVNLLSRFQKQFPPTNNQLRTSTNPMTQATIQAGHVAKECKEKKRAKDSQWFKDKALLMEAKEKGAILDAEAEAFLADVECTTPYAEPLAITTTTAFEVSHEDAYDSDVDEAPHAAAAFMANLMQTGPSTGQGTSNDTDFHSEKLCLSSREDGKQEHLIELLFEFKYKNSTVKLVTTAIGLEGMLVLPRKRIIYHIFEVEVEFHSSLIPLSRGNFDVIMGMDWLSKRKFVIVCHEKVVKIPLEGEEILQAHGERTQGVVKTLMNTKVVAKSPYRLAPSDMQELSAQLRELQDKGFIRPSHFLRGAPVLFMKDTGCSVCMCIDIGSLVLGWSHEEGEVVDAKFPKLRVCVRYVRDWRYILRNWADWNHNSMSGAVEKGEAFKTLKIDLCDTLGLKRIVVGGEP